ncbi:hypothetical protein MetfoDRAFT_1417 [Methanotorris formicicus Mc-S-70]|uniref:Uncharacterized protein n=1 Tax=Methanotorris formicicus Mc-S-70 TaxID=647171 RepID=H1L043_9EURY|nr:hypothetical protein MetfoDRAFT_1417 [Methanotorris formicicus Mc-S-70]
MIVFIGVSVLTCANLDNSSEQLNPKLFIELVSILLSAASIGDAPFFNELFKYYLFLFFGFKVNIVKSHYQKIKNKKS